MKKTRLVQQRFRMTEEEHIKLVEVSNEFGPKIKTLIREALKQMPPELIDLTITYLMENHGSFYHALDVEYVDGLPKMVLR